MSAKIAHLKSSKLQLLKFVFLLGLMPHKFSRLRFLMPLNVTFEVFSCFSSHGQLIPPPLPQIIVRDSIFKFLAVLDVNGTIIANPTAST